MNYIIPKKKLFDAIYSHIDSELKKDNLDWRFVDDDDFDESYNKNLIEFFGDKWFGEGEPIYFQYIKKEYYDEDGTTDFLIEKWYDKAPLLDFIAYENPFWEHLNDTFGDLWKPVIKKWFEDHYPEFPVKTYVMR